MKKLFFSIILVVFLTACGGGNAAEKTATEYLNALKNKDFKKAKTLATEETATNLDMLESMGADLGLSEVKDVKCIVKEYEATCTFCCSKDTSFKELKLKKEAGKWLAHQPKEVPPTETGDTTSLNDIEHEFVSESAKLNKSLDSIENSLNKSLDSIENILKEFK